MNVTNMSNVLVPIGAIGFGALIGTAAAENTDEGMGAAEIVLTSTLPLVGGAIGAGVALTGELGGNRGTVVAGAIAGAGMLAAGMLTANLIPDPA